MKFNSQICTTKEQSECLLALGLKKETADCRICPLITDPNQYFITDMGIQPLDEDETPAWSLHRLMEMMPNVITHDDHSLILGVNASCVYYADGEYAETFEAFEGNLYNYVHKCIEWLIKVGYFNKEYLEEL